MTSQHGRTDMDYVWLYSACQCSLFVSVVVASVRMLISVNAAGVHAYGGLRPRSVASCLRLCLGWAGAVGGAVEVPVTVVANLRTRQCLYACAAVVCLPLLVRQFTMCLLVLLTLDTHLQQHFAERYSSVLTRGRALCVVLLCWVASVLSSFSQFIGSDVLDTWRDGSGSVGLELEKLTTTLPHLSPSPPPKYHHDLKVIGRFLPYGGFLSKFYTEDLSNFTYAEIHSSHWGVCAPDTILSPEYLFYVHGTAVIVLPLLCILGVYLDSLCMKPRKTDPLLEPDSRRVGALALSLSLLVLLCSPLHIVYGVLLFNPATAVPAWVHAVASFLFQLYSLVPQILFTPPRKNAEEPFPLSVLSHPPLEEFSQKSVCGPLAMPAVPWPSSSLKTKVFPRGP